MQTREVVRPPATDRPALTNQTTAILLKVLARKVKSATSGLYLAPLLLLSIGTQFIGGAILEPPFLILYGISGVLFLVMVGQATYARVRFGRWLPRAERLLAARPWREAPVSVIGSGFVEVRDGTDVLRLRVVGMYDAVRQVMARTGRVWLVGPDSRGWAVLRVDGTHAPWPARRARGGSGSAPRPADRGGLRTAADDPVSASWARTARRLLLMQLWPYALFTVVFVLVAVALSWVTHVVVPWLVFGLVFVIPCLVLVAVKLRRGREHRRLPALLRVGPWRRVRAELQPWAARPTGLADASGAVWLDNGVRLDVALPGANVDLLGNIRETGTVWLAGEPASGGTFAAGFPGYPVLGVARLS